MTAQTYLPETQQIWHQHPALLYHIRHEGFLYRRCMPTTRTLPNTSTSLKMAIEGGDAESIMAAGLFIDVGGSIVAALDYYLPN